jgi:hypothetical protein
MAGQSDTKKWQEVEKWEVTASNALENNQNRLIQQYVNCKKGTFFSSKQLANL